MNPARRSETSFKPALVTVAMLVYIPSLSGYFQNRLDILKLSIASLLSNTSTQFDFFVLDNGSCEEVISFLRTLNTGGKIDCLMLSANNMGVEGGVRILANSIPGKYFAFTNDDVFFYPNWLEAHLRILNTMPKAGLVSGAPVGFSSEDAHQSTRELISDGYPGLTVMKRERNLEWERDWAASTGRDVEKHLLSASNSPFTLLQFENVSAVSSATHFQFVSLRDVIPQAVGLNWREELMDGMVEMDQAVDDLGLLRLSTVDRYTRHIGNEIGDDFQEEAERLDVSIQSHYIKTTPKKHWSLYIPGFGRILRKLYHWLFEILHGSK